jgi:hypothetical protein
MGGACELFRQHVSLNQLACKVTKRYDGIVLLPQRGAYL